MQVSVECQDGEEEKSVGPQELPADLAPPSAFLGLGA